MHGSFCKFLKQIESIFWSSAVILGNWRLSFNEFIVKTDKDRRHDQEKKETTQKKSTSMLIIECKKSTSTWFWIIFSTYNCL